MEISTVTLMLIAGLLHASWHAIVKSRSGHITLAGMGVISSLLALPVALFSDIPSLYQCIIILISLIFHAGYKIFLANAYRSADFGKVYPVTRGLVPFNILFIDLMFRNTIYSFWHIIGICLTCIGGVGLSYKHITKKVDKKILFFGLVTSLMAACYSLIDGYGTKIGSGWISFTSWLIISDGVFFLLFARLFYGSSLWLDLNTERKNIIIAGILGTFSFVIFLWALSKNPVAETVAFRECSVIFAVLIGIIFLDEPVIKFNLMMSGLIFLGLVLISYF